MEEELENILVELVAFQQHLGVLSLRQTGTLPYHKSHITSEEYWKAAKKLNYEFLKLPEHVQEKVKKVRLENYNIR